MENQDHKTVPPAGHFESGGQHKPPFRSAAPTQSDSVSAYIEKNLNAAELAEDIQKLVTQRVQSSIPDDKKLMLELVHQVGELTGEVKQLRQQLDTKPYAVFTCPSGQMKDITEELAEIKALLREDPKPHELSVPDIDPIMLGPSRRNINVEPPAPEPPAPAPQAETPSAPIDGNVSTPPPQSAPQSEAETDFAAQMTPKSAPQAEKPKKKRTVASVLGNLLFYVVMLGLVVGAFLAKSGSGGSPTVIAGYSAFTVLSSSMEDTYPKGSLIVTHSVDPNELQIGDDITYMASATSSITHRIIGITEDYLGTGARSFETQGTMNKDPDKDPVAAANVVGKVIFCSVLLGQAAAFISANWPLLLFFVAVMAALIAFLRWNFRREDGTEPKKNAHKKA